MSAMEKKAKSVSADGIDGKKQVRKVPKSAAKAGAADKKQQKAPAGGKKNGSNGSSLGASMAHIDGEGPGAEMKPKPKPMDVSNGKALFAKHSKCQYNSISLGKWVDATVTMVDPDGQIMIDIKDNCWFTVEEQKEKFRDMPHKCPWSVGDLVQYKSVTQNCWVACKIIAVDPNTGSVQIDVKEKYWMKVEEQEQKLRPHMLVPTDELIWEAGQLLDKDFPDVAGAEAKLQKVLDLEDDNTKAMDVYAILLRDHRADHGQAEAMYKEALLHNPFDVKILSDYSDLLIFHGRPEEAKPMQELMQKVRVKLKEFEDEARERAEAAEEEDSEA